MTKVYLEKSSDSTHDFLRKFRIEVDEEGAFIRYKTEEQIFNVRKDSFPHIRSGKSVFLPGGERSIWNCYGDIEVKDVSITVGKTYRVHATLMHPNEWRVSFEGPSYYYQFYVCLWL